jgi:hypothetical protein
LEDITGLAWLDEKHLISVSKQATINVYSVKLGVKVKVFTTDYGPITSMKHSASDSLLVTGTEYGYAVGYKISDSGNQIVCDKKMVKINGVIKAVDFHIRPRDVPMDTSAPKDRQKRPASRKRKRSASSEESDDEDSDDGDDHMKGEFLATSDITIFGACDKKVVVWDYHKMKILDSVALDHDVTCVLALDNGDFAIGDSEGYLSIYDHETFTCRQNERILKTQISCLTRDAKNSVVLAAGREPIITLLKTDAISATRDEYILFERIKDHSAQVNCALFTSKKEFFTCSDDDLIIKFRMSKSDGKRKLKRFATKSNHQSRIHCGLNEMMVLPGRALHIYDIDANSQFTPEIETYPMRQSLPEPRRTCVIQAYTYVHSATFDDKWLCYSTDRGTTIIDRPGLSKLSTPSQDLPNCHILKLCQSGRYLVAGQQKKLTITKLGSDSIDHETNDEHGKQVNGDGIRSDAQSRVITSNDDSKVHKTIFTCKLKGMVRDILYQQSDDRLIISCGTTRHFLYILQLPRASTSDDTSAEQKVDIIHKFGLPSSPSSHLAINHHDPHDSNLYICTTKNQFIKCDTRIKALKTELTKLIEGSGSVSNFPKDKNVQGIVILSKSHCLMYDSNYISKLDIDNNEIVNETPKYDDINIVCNTIFKQPGEILIA